MTEPVLKPAPFWVRWISSGGWMTLGTTIYFPPQVKPYDYPHVIEHERAHSARQQQYGVARYIARYLVDDMFRYHEELFGYAVQVAWYMRNAPGSVEETLDDCVARLKQHAPASERDLRAQLRAWAVNVIAGAHMGWEGELCW